MHILLPPSETKRPGGGSVFSLRSLSYAPELHETRVQVMHALEQLSTDHETAVRALKLGAKSAHEVALNLELASSGVMPAIERYTGVLFDALDTETLNTDARAWVDRRVFVQSALFGLIAAADEIPAYRLSAGTRLPELGKPLHRIWSAAHAKLPWSEWSLDLRSQEYVKLAPAPSGVATYVHIVQRQADGQARALNHFNKSAKGLLVRQLALMAPDLGQAADFLDWARDAGIEVILGEEGEALTLVLPEREVGEPLGSVRLHAGARERGRLSE